jgi:LDH2 family malate/lactate/ureidoglycolate dehydrogenase
MPSHNDEIRLSASFLKDFASQILHKAGMPREDADLTADSLIFANLRGIDTHGVTRLDTLVRKLEAGVVNAHPRVKIIKDKGGTVVVDGDDGMGQVVANKAMKIAIERAAETGVALVGAINAGHIGALAFWSMMALAHDMIGFCTSNGSCIVAPWGGREPRFANQPITIAAPTGKGFPLVLDMALTLTSRGKISLAAKNKHSIPKDWAMDEHGRPTGDPDEALKGGLLAIGGYKGADLAIMIEVLTAVLLGGNFGPQCGWMAPPDKILSKPLGFNNLMAAVNIENFTPVRQFKERIDQLIETLKAVPRAKDVDTILMPNEKEYLYEQKRTKAGIPINEVMVNELNGLAQKFDLPPIDSGDV